MGIAAANLLPLCLSLLAGFGLYRFNWRFLQRHIDTVANASMYILMMFMGISIGQMEGFFDMVVRVGVTALLIAIATSLGTMVVIWCVIYLPLRGMQQNEQTSLSDMVREESVKDAMPTLGLLHHIVAPLKMIGMVAIGFILAWAHWLPKASYEHAATGLLYVMTCAIGFQLAMSNVRFKELVANRRGLKIALCVLVGTYLGAILVAPLLPLPLQGTLGAASGFGWASLSGILFTQLGQPVTGSIAFLTDMFREALALLLIPLLSHRQRGRMAIGVCAATCMDVTLPVIERHNPDRRDVTAAFVSGSLLSFAVPFLIPLTVV